MHKNIDGRGVVVLRTVETVETFEVNADLVKNELVLMR